MTRTKNVYVSVLNGVMVTAVSVYSGKERTLLLPITLEQVFKYEHGGALIQDAFPHLDADQREFLMTGVTAEEWNSLFPEEEEE